MKRLLAVVAVVTAAAGYVRFASSSSPPPSERASDERTSQRTARELSRGPVLMYGDSLLEQASPYVRSTDQIRAFGGTALCDWVDNMARAAAVEQPSALVVEFVGNDATACMKGHRTPEEILAKYQADAEELKRRVNVPILWVQPPAFRDRLPPTAGLYESEPGVIDAGRAVLADGAYTDTLPCLPDEGWEQGCVNGRIRVRALDGAHFFTAGSGYSAGGRRFADAIDEAVREVTDG